MIPFQSFLAGKNILVTGAGRGDAGLGKALTGALHDCNANVTALSKTSKKLEELRAEFPRIRTLCVDLRDWETTRKMLTKIESPFDGVINNAATAHPESVMNITPETFQTVMDTNLRAVLNVTQSVVPKMIEAGKGGSIVNISSLMSVRGSNLAASYSISKCGVNMLTRLMALELGKHKIRVNAVCPAGFESDLLVDGMDSHFGKGKGMQVRNEKTVRRTPLGKPLLEIEEIVNATLFVLSDAVPMMTGHSMLIDGGFTLT